MCIETICSLPLASNDEMQNGFVLTFSSFVMESSKNRHKIYNILFFPFRECFYPLAATSIVLRNGKAADKRTPEIETTHGTLRSPKI